MISTAERYSRIPPHQLDPDLNQIFPAKIKTALLHRIGLRDPYHDTRVPHANVISVISGISWLSVSLVVRLHSARRRCVLFVHRSVKANAVFISTQFKYRYNCPLNTVKRFLMFAFRSVSCGTLTHTHTHPQARTRQQYQFVGVDRGVGLARSLASFAHIVRTPIAHRISRQPARSECSHKRQLAQA